MSRSDVYDGDAKGCIRGAPYSFPLGECARSGNLEGLRYQLDAGADIDDVDYRGESALILASSWDQLKAVELLLERGANVHRIGALGNALCAVQPGWRPNALDIAQLLLARGCSPIAKESYCESAVEKFTEAARRPEKKVAPKLLQFLLLILPHAGEHAPEVSAAIANLEKKLGKSATKDKKAAASLAELATASGKTWPQDVRNAAGSLDKNAEGIKKIIDTVLTAPAAVKHPKWPAVVREMLALSRTYGDATKAAYGKALPLSKMESDEGSAMEYLADEHLYTWDWLLAMLAQPAPQTHAEWPELVLELCKAKRKAVGTYSFGDDEIAALLGQPFVKTHARYAELVAAAKQAFPFAAPTKTAAKKPTPRKAAPKKSPPKAPRRR